MRGLMMSTTIKLKDETKNKLSDLKKDGQTYDQLINELLTTKPGANVDDITEIQREKIAFSLEQNTLNENNEIIETKQYNVSFYELYSSDVGDIIEIENNVKFYINETAKIIYKDETSLFVKITISTNSITGFYKDFELLHIHMF